ncbi:MAG: glycosyltransferase family 2 protein [Candidatus Omnitrophota bacterium]
MFNQSISIVLPAYNEEENLRPLVEKCLEYLRANFKRFEIVIVDDGSRDMTAKIADEFADRNRHLVRVFHHHPNQGYGAALRTGLLNSKADLVFYTDSDNQFDIYQINEFMPFVDSYDVLLGYRYPRKDPLYRLLVSGGYNLLASLVFKLKVKDINSSFKIFHRYVFNKINIISDEFFVDAEIIAKARYNNFSILEMPVKHFPRGGGSTTVNLHHVFSTLKEMAAVFKELRFKK